MGRFKNDGMRFSQYGRELRGGEVANKQIVSKWRLWSRENWGRKKEKLRRGANTAKSDKLKDPTQTKQERNEMGRQKDDVQPWNLSKPTGNTLSKLEKNIWDG